MRNVFLIPLRLFTLLCFKLIIDSNVKWENVRFEKRDVTQNGLIIKPGDYYHDTKNDVFLHLYKDDYRTYEIARDAYEDSVTRFNNISAKIMSTSQLHGIVFAAVSLIKVNAGNALSVFSLTGLMFKFASIFLAVYSLGIKTEFIFEYGLFNNTQNLSSSAKRQFWYVIRKKNDISDYLADAYKIITFFLCISLFFIFLDLLPFVFLKNHDCLICTLIVLLWMVYKFFFLTMLVKFIEKMENDE